MIKVYNNRIVSPSEFKISNKFENDTQTIQFDLSDVKTKGNVYLICKYEKDNEYKQPLLLDENNSIPVKTFLSSKPGKYISVLAISNILIDNDYNFSDDNIMFISNQFEMNVEDNFLSGSSIEWDLSPEMKIKFDELIALVEKVQSDLEAGAFNGVGIKSIEKVSSQGLIDNYKITFTDESIFEYQVTNGKDGEMPTITIVDGKWNVNGIDTGQKAQGEEGLSAYEVAVKNGFEGSEQDWLESLKYQSSPEFNQLAEQVRADAETTTQNKKDIEKLVSDFNTNYDTKLKEFNNNAESKNEEFNTNVQSANAIIDRKVTEAAAQAEKAKEEANRATQATDGKLDKNQGAENVGKVMVVDEEGNLIPGESLPKNIYTKEEVDYLLDDKMDKPYYDITISDDTTIENTLAGNFKMKSIECKCYQAEESDIVPTPSRPVPINSRKVKVGEEYVELRSLKETGNIWDLKPFTDTNNAYYQSNDIEANCWGKQLVTGLTSILKPNTTYSARVTVEMVEKVADEGFTQSSMHKRIYLFRNQTDDLSQINAPIIDCQTELRNGETATVTNTFTTPSDLTNVNILFYTERYTNAEGTAKYSTVKFKDITLVEGSTVPETYISPTIRDYKIVDHTTKTSKIVRNTFELLLTGAENWKLGNSYGDLSQHFYLSTQYVSDTSNDIKNTHFKVENPYALNEDCLGFFVRDVRIRYGKYDGNIEGLKQWLSENNVRVFGKLQTPTEESIPYIETDTSEVGYSWQDSTSPSPDIPSEIYEVDKFNIKLIGKNLFDLEKAKNKDLWEGGNTYRHFTGIYLKPNTTYTLSISKNNMYKDYKAEYNGNFAFYIGETKNAASPNTLIGNTGANIGGIKNKYTFTTTDKQIYFNLYVKEWNDENMNIVFDELLQNLQIEQSETATSYESYQETSIQHTLSKPLRAAKDGSIKDIIDIVNMQITYNMTDFIVDGNTTIVLGTDKEKTRVIQINNHPFLNATNNLKMYCDKLLNDSGKDEELFTVSSDLFIAISKNRVAENDISEFKKWFGENPLYFIGISKNPTTEPLEDELVQKLKTLKTFSPVTHVFIEGIVKPTLNAQYPKDIAVAQAQLEQKVLLISETLKTTQANLLLQGGND